jgi:hypothetical protein
MIKKGIFAIVIALVFIACDNDTIVGEGPIVTEEISIENFRGIETYGDDNVHVSYGETQKVTVTGYQNIIDNLETDVQNGIWEIELKNGNYKNSQLTINIVMPLLNVIELQGSGSIEISDFESDTNVAVNLYGSGNITLNSNIGCENLTINMEGSGVIYAMGNFQDLINLTIDMDGSGTYSGFSNSSVNCYIDISGSSTCNVTVETILAVKISGSGVVNYKGNPAITSNISGSGKINDFND